MDGLKHFDNYQSNPITTTAPGGGPESEKLNQGERELSFLHFFNQGQKAAAAAKGKRQETEYTIQTEL